MTAPEARAVSLAVPIGAGVVTALVGFTSSFAVVLTGLRAAGATEAQAASGLFALSLIMGFGIVGLALRYRIPLTLAWSTPGAALLAGTGAVVGGWPAAVGAFVVVGLAIVLTGAWPRLGALVASIPVSLAQAMLAGVILPLCLEPVRALAASPVAVAPVVLTWLVLQRFSPRWAVPAAFGVAAVVIGLALLRSGTSVPTDGLVPTLSPVAPVWTWQAAVGVALPLYIVTMASQNIPGTAVMASYGYTVPWRASMTVTGAATAAAAPIGAFAVNLAAISAALAASPDAEPDRERRWIAAVTAGVAYLVLAVGSAALATLVALAPAGIVETVAGLALLGTLASALAASTQHPSDRVPAAITFVVAASGVAVVGIGSAFWALVAGLVVRAVTADRA